MKNQSQLKITFSNQEIYKLACNARDPESFLKTQITDINALDDEGMSLLHYAGINGKIEIIKILFEKFSANINILNLDKKTALHIASIRGHNEVIKYLLSKGSDIFLQSSSGHNALHYAAHYGKTQIVTLLLEALDSHWQKNLLESKDIDGNHPIHYAALYSNIEILNILIRFGANVNIQNKYGDTPLHFAASRNTHPQIIKKLLEEGANIKILNINGDSAFNLAIKFNNYEIAKILKQSEIYPYNETPLDVLELIKLGNEAFGRDKSLCLDFYAKALQLAEEISNWQGVVYSLIELGEYYLFYEDYKKAAMFYTSARIYTEQNNGVNIFNSSFFEEKQYCLEVAFLRKICKNSEKSPEVVYPFIIERLKSERKEVEDSLTNFKNFDYIKKLKFTSNGSGPIISSGNEINNINTKSKQILATITNYTKIIVSDLITDCIKKVGTPPCKYAILGLGSMGRLEMGPFSDIELAILVENKDKKIVSYFDKLLQMFELKVISIGETQFKILNKGKSSITKNGFCLDSGGNTPIHKSELIGTVYELIEFQALDKFKDDLILSNVLKTTTLIQGDEKLFTLYIQQLNSELDIEANTGYKVRMEHALHLMEGDILEFEPRLGKDKQSNQFHIKKEIYRLPNNLVSYLSLYYGIEKQNSWDKLDALLAKRFVSEHAYENVKILLDFGTIMRVKTHLFYGCENEDIYHRSLNRDSLTSIEKIYQITDAEMRFIEESYAILRPMHQGIIKFVNSKGESNFINRPLEEDSLYIQAEQATEEGHFDLAIELYEKTLSINPDDIDSLLGMASLKIQLEQSNFLELINEVERKVGIIINENICSSLSKDKIAILNYKVGIFFIKYSLYDKSIDYLLIALSNFLDINGEDHGSLVLPYEKLATIYALQGESEEALNLLFKASSIRENLYDKEDYNLSFAQVIYEGKSLVETSAEEEKGIIICYSMIASILIQQGKYQEAYDYLLRVLAKWEPKRINENEDPYTIVNRLVVQGRYEAAKDYLSQFIFEPDLWGELERAETLEMYNTMSETIEIIIDELKAQHGIETDDKNNITDRILVLGQKEYLEYKECIYDYFKKNKENKNQTFNIRINMIIGSINEMIGNVISKGGGDKKNIENYKQTALNISKQMIGKNNDEATAVSYYSLSKSLANQGELEEAINCCKQALSIYKNIPGKHNLEIINCYLLIGQLFKDQNNYDKAIIVFKKAFNLLNNGSGIKNEAVPLCCHFIASSYHAQGKIDEAMEYYLQELEATETVHVKNHHAVAGCYNNLGIILFSQNKYEEALKYHQQALKIRNTIYDKPHQDIAWSNTQIARVLKALKEYNEAFDYYKQALEIWKKADSVKQTDIASVYTEISEVLITQEKFEEALIFKQEQLELLRTIYGEEHRQVCLYETSNTIEAENIKGPGHDSSTSSRQPIPYELIILLNKYLFPITRSFINKAGANFDEQIPGYLTNSEKGEVIFTLHTDSTNYAKILHYYNENHPGLISKGTKIEPNELGSNISIAMNSTILYYQILPTLNYEQYAKPEIFRKQPNLIPQKKYSDQHSIKQPLLHSLNYQEYTEQKKCCGGCIMM